jgi:uncharacterized protein (UPF0261 family)
LIARGMFAGIIDYTLSELAGEIAGGFHAPSRPRVVAAGAAGVPQVVVATCVDFTAHGAKHMVPESLRQRASYYHNPEATLVRIDAQEMRAIGVLLAERVNAAIGPVAVVLPTEGFSIGGAPGGSLYDPSADRQFVDAFKQHLAPRVRMVEVAAHSNSDACADASMQLLLEIVGPR